jgi:hypothetical protein
LQSHDSPSFVVSLDLLPEEIFGTEEVPKYIPSDSSVEEDATPEHKTNHQLRRRIRHLEHNLRDITAHCSAEHERRMSLEALVGGKIFILIQFSCLSFRSHIQSRICSLSSDVSDRYNNLKASWDSLM